MKLITFCFIFLFSPQILARQYFQCNSLDLSTTDVMVINLKSTQVGTVFISPGMESPDSKGRLINIELSKIEDKIHHYSLLGEVPGSVLIPSAVIGKSSHSVNIELNFDNIQIFFSCFARIYND